MWTEIHYEKSCSNFYTFQEFEALLRRCCFLNNEVFEAETIDTYFRGINYYPDTPIDGVEELHLSDYDALPVLSKIVGIRLANTHVSHDGQAIR